MNCHEEQVLLPVPSVTGVRKINPQADKLVAICKALDMSLVDLLCDEEDAEEVTQIDYIFDEKHIIEVFRNSNYETKRRLLRSS